LWKVFFFLFSFCYTKREKSSIDSIRFDTSIHPFIMVLTIKDFVKEPRTPRSRALHKKMMMVNVSAVGLGMGMGQQQQQQEQQEQEQLMGENRHFHLKEEDEATLQQQLQQPQHPLSLSTMEEKHFPLVVQSLTTATTKTETETTRNTRHVQYSQQYQQQQQQEEQPTTTSLSLSHESTSHSTTTTTTTSTVLLHDLIVNRQYEQAMERLYLAPREATLVVGGGGGSIMQHGRNLALHEACNHQAPLELVRLLLHIHPQAVSLPGQWGYLPLHFAVCSRAPTNVVATLLETYPSATRHADNSEHKLPLHLAAKWGASPEVLLLLLTVYPKAALAKDAADKTPLDHAMFVAQQQQTSDSPMAMTAAQQAVHWLQNVAPLLQSVHQAAKHKLEHDYDVRLQEALHDYHDRFQHVKVQYDDDDKLQAESLERQLRDELQRAHDDAARYRQQVDELLLLWQEQQLLQQQQQQQRDATVVTQEETAALLQDRVDTLERQLEQQSRQESQHVVALQQQIHRLEEQVKGKEDELRQSRHLLQQIQGLLLAVGTKTTEDGKANQFVGRDADRDNKNVSSRANGDNEQREPPPPPPTKAEEDVAAVADKYPEHLLLFDTANSPKHDHPRHHYGQIGKTKSAKNRPPTPKKSRDSNRSPQEKRRRPKLNPKDLILNVVMGGNSYDDSMDRDDHLAETRDPPPSSFRGEEEERATTPPRQQQQHRLDTHGHDKIERMRNAVPSPRADAVASVQDWFATTTTTTMTKAPPSPKGNDSVVDDDLLSRLLAPSDRSIVADEKVRSDTRSSAIRHGYAKETKLQQQESRDAYRHYKQEYESLLSRSKSNLRRRMESAGKQGDDELPQQQQQHLAIYSKSSWEKRTTPTTTRKASKSDGSKKSSDTTSRQGSKQRRSNKPVEVIIERKAVMSSSHKQKDDDHRRHNLIKVAASIPTPRDAEDYEGDEDSTLVSAMNE
jgi:Ankyrin repeats (3 copies)